MGSVTRFFFENFPQWDRSAKIAFAMGFVLLLVMLFLGASLPAENRGYVIIGVVGTLVVMQAIFLWANRGMVAEFTRAQRLYLEEDFEAARDVLNEALNRQPDDFKMWTLLGNTYRQMSDLSQSESALRRALELAPDHHFALYSLGRTLLVKGDYSSAVELLEHALIHGAPEIVRVDLAEALYRRGESHETVKQALYEALPVAKHEAHREFLVNLLLYRLGEPVTIDSAHVDEGIRYLQDQAARFASTPYGRALQDDLNAI